MPVVSNQSAIYFTSKRISFFPFTSAFVSTDLARFQPEAKRQERHLALAWLDATASEKFGFGHKVAFQNRSGILFELR